MKIELVRIFTCPTYTIGKLYVDGEWVCDTLEDTDRGLDQSMSEAEIRKRKVYRQTAIPTGTYKVTMDIPSPKFSQYPFYRKLCKGYLPRLLEVKGFDGILMHCGSTADNSAGCILIGLNTVKGRLTNSQKTYTTFMGLHMLPAKKMKEEITITITRKYKI